jgi:hypothetical protein
MNDGLESPLAERAHSPHLGSKLAFYKYNTRNIKYPHTKGSAKNHKYLKESNWEGHFEPIFYKSQEFQVGQKICAEKHRYSHLGPLEQASKAELVETCVRHCAAKVPCLKCG